MTENNLTVGKLEDMLRAYPKNTIIHTDCRCCSHGATGSSVLSISDMTNQTYGYIELRLNATINPKKEVTADEKDYYEKSIELLLEENKKLRFRNSRFEEALNDIKKSAEGSIRWIAKWGD